MRDKEYFTECLIIHDSVAKQLKSVTAHVALLHVHAPSAMERVPSNLPFLISR